MTVVDDVVGVVIVVVGVVVVVGVHVVVEGDAVLHAGAVVVAVVVVVIADVRRTHIYIYRDIYICIYIYMTVSHLQGVSKPPSTQLFNFGIASI